MVGWMDGWMDGMMDGRTDTETQHIGKVTIPEESVRR
jgi:hypothetical protein